MCVYMYMCTKAVYVYICIYDHSHMCLSTIPNVQNMLTTIHDTLTNTHMYIQV